jgi:CheY-like chemotaxis protein
MKEKDLLDKFIIVGEDDIDDKDILEELFSSIDSSVKLHFLNNGEKLVYFLEIAEAKNLPCLILLDYNMPGLNGAEILSSLQNNDRLKHIPKVIWSTSDAAIFKNKCLELGACDYLVKPSSVKDLKNTIQYILSFCPQ